MLLILLGDKLKDNWLFIIVSWYELTDTPGIKPTGSIPCLSKCPPINETPACAIVEVGK